MCKKLRYLAAALGLLLFLCAVTGCEGAPTAVTTPEPTAESTPAPTPEPTPTPDLYEAVLFGGAEVLIIDSGGYMTLEGILGRYDEFELYISEFAAVDMDGDGAPELALSLCAVEQPDFTEYLLLHREADTVYAVSFPYRGFLGLKEDGTFERASGAGTVAICSVAYGAVAYSIDKITYCEAYAEPDGTWGELYFVNHQSATEEEYRAAAGEWYETQSAAWQDFNSANVGVALHSVFPLRSEQPVG